MDRKFVKNIISVTVSNVILLLSGILVSFVIPKILSLEGYGYYKTFTLYISYLGLFSIGILDGIDVVYGDKNLENLEPKLFRGYTKILTGILLIFSIVALALGFIYAKNEFFWIFLFCSICIFPINMIGYFQHISQITQRFKEYSHRNIIKSILTILFVIILYVYFKYNNLLDYKIYVICVVFINYFMFFWYLFTYKNISFGKSVKLKECFGPIRTLSKKGFPLMMANLCSTLLLSLDRQFVSVLFSNTTYATYAFAYNMFALVTVATSAVSSVLYPSLKRMNIENLEKNYCKYITYMLIFVFFALAIYFPLYIFIEWYLPNYVNSLIIFRIIFPGLAINSCITIIMLNFYKALGKSKNYFIKSLFVLAISFSTNLAAYLIFKSEIAISIASIISLLIQYILVDFMFFKKNKTNCFKNFIYLLLLMVMFYLATGLKNIFIGLGIYVFAYLLITLCFYFKILKKEFLRRKVKDD